LQTIPEADIYCTGSDQTWNSKWNRGVDESFFLSFAPEDNLVLHIPVVLDEQKWILMK
jgi:hypothetical protein